MKFYVDGVPLQESRGRWAVLHTANVAPPLSARVPSVTIPGIEGSPDLSEFNKLDAPQLTISMKILGSSKDDLMANYTAIAGLFRNGKKISRETETGKYSTSMEFVSSTRPDYNNVATQINVDMVVRLPNVFWRTDFYEWDSPTMPNDEEVSIFNNMSAPVLDAQLMFYGSGANPYFECGDNWGRVNVSLTSSEKLLVNTHDFTAFKGSGVTWSGGGTEVSQHIEYSGGPYLFPMEPSILGSNPRVTEVRIKATGADHMAVRARRAELV